MTVAALFVDPKGIYSTLPDVECWGEDRDARTYAGPWPVVAHPPCQLWTNLTGVNYKRYGGAHNRPGNDGGCFAWALGHICRYSGVLEHPAGSYAWNTFALKRPEFGKWRRAGSYWTTEVWQSAYGHPARKRTWLLYAGDNPPPELDWSDNPGTHQIGWFDRIKPTLSKREASATPRPFAELLVSMARNARTKAA